MARNVAVIVGLALVTTLAVCASPGIAADVLKIGVLDPQVIIEKSKAGKRDLTILRESVRARQQLLATDEEELKTLEKQLQNQEKDKTVTEEQKREKQNQFRAKVQDYQRRTQEYNQELQVKQKELMDDLLSKVAAATKSVAEKGGFSLVMDKGSDVTIKIVIYNRETIDLTDQILKEFDRQNK